MLSNGGDPVDPMFILRRQLQAKGYKLFAGQRAEQVGRKAGLPSQFVIVAPAGFRHHFADLREVQRFAASAV